jgi:hypothetical protein
MSPCMRGIVALVVCLAAACGPRHPAHRVSTGEPGAEGVALDGAALDATRSDLGTDGQSADRTVAEPLAPDAAMPDAAAPDVAAPDAAAPDAAAPDAASACLPAPAADEWVATFETDQSATTAVAGRGGTPWVIIPADAGATLAVVPIPERCGSRRALRFSGSGFVSRQPLAQALFLSAAATGIRFLDARAYSGLRLSVRASAVGRITLKVPDRNTTRPGGVCQSCNDHFAADLAVTTEWKTFTILWSSLAQAGTGDRFGTLDTAALFGLELFPAPTDGAFELWIDDVSFVR